jgi:hypothetical protein
MYWLPKNTVLQLSLSRCLNVSGDPSWIRTGPRRGTRGVKDPIAYTSDQGNWRVGVLFYRTGQNQRPLSSWLGQLLNRAHQNVVIVALANKLLRM